MGAEFYMGYISGCGVGVKFVQVPNCPQYFDD